MLIKIYRNDGSEHWINPKYVAHISLPEGRYEGTITLAGGELIGYARPANLPELINQALAKETQ